MSLPPPQLRDLTSMNEAKYSPGTETNEVWEIGVPAKRSLYWSIMLSYLLSCNDDRFSEFLNMFNCPETPTKGKQQKRLSRSGSFNDRVVKKFIRSFNPFKNRHAFFHEIEMVNVFRAFMLKLKQYGKELESETDAWNDDFKLKAASKLLNCKIKVYFPDSTQPRSLCIQSSPTDEKLPLIILFQYENQKYRSRTEDINIFRFSISLQYAHGLKLDALVYILKKAKLSTHVVKSIQQMMNHAENHGQGFLPTLLQSPHFEILPDLYKSPYIAVKLSEAGFETNPAVVNPPSPFLYAMSKSNTKYVRILYDYAVNCRYLFDKTVRDADDTILDSIQNLNLVLQNDKSKMNKCNLNTFEKKWILNRVFCHFNAFQQEIVTAVTDCRKRKQQEIEQLHQNSSAKHKVKVDKEILNIQKQVIQNILDSYSKFFYYKIEERDNILEKFDSYLNFTEYYENTDYFSCLCFFDNIHLLKKIFQFENEDIYANIESTFFLLIVSSKYFTKFEHNAECDVSHDETNSGSSRNSLRFIPLLYRENLKAEMQNFTKKLKLEEPVIQKDKIKEDCFRSSLSSYPVIRDELLIARIKKYITAASQITFEEDGMKGILAIERALQVIGESIKPQSTKDCVVSCLLGCRLPPKTKQELAHIRNELSHYRAVLADGRIDIEQNVEFLKKLQEEIVKIGKAFEIVAFTQYLRLEEYLIDKGRQELNNHHLSQNFIADFLQDFKERLIERKRDYAMFQNECIILSLDIINDFKMYISEKKVIKARGKMNCNSDIYTFFKSIEYILFFMSKFINENFFQPYCLEIQKYHEEYKSKKEFLSLDKIIESLYEKYSESVKKMFALENSSGSLLALPETESFLRRIKIKSVDASDMELILKAVTNAYDEALKAKNELKQYVELEAFELTDKEELLLKKLVISPGRLKKLREYFKNKKAKLALKELNKPWVEKGKLLNTVEKLFESNSIEEGDAKSFIIKITNQRHLAKIIYTSINLNESLCNKLENILTKKTQFLLSRINDIKSILIDEDGEIKEAWNWGRSKAIKSHMKFLMRQRFLREMPVRAALEMALFDCFNILEREDFKNVYEKLNNLFTGINLRNVLSHGHSILETTCGLIDEDDLPSELINKMLDLIEDSEVIHTMLKLIPCSDTLEKEIFESFIDAWEDSNDTFKHSMKKITECPTWRNYLFLLPLF